MGWSCRAEAAETMNRINTIHSRETGCFEFCGDEYFVEWSINREHADGAITGKLMKMIGGGFAVKIGSIRIDPEGELVRAPSALKERMEELS